MNERKPLDGFVPINTSERYKEMTENVFFNPKQGKHIVTCLSNIMEKRYFDEVGAARTDFAIALEVEGKKCIWMFGKGKAASRYGQLLEIQNKYDILVNRKLEIIVKINGQTNEGKDKRDYTILEA